MKNLIKVSLPALLLVLSAPAHSQGAAKDTADVIGQGAGGPLYEEDAATIIRSPKGISASISMATPMPGSYSYPAPNAFQDRVIPGHPEVFTGWIFIFNNPAECSDDVCNGDDFGPTPARGGAYNFAGHPVDGSTLTLTGHISVGDEPFVGVPLDNPTGAEVHLAVAPHGMVLPDLLPQQINTPIGTPAEWWLALFFAD